METLKSGSKEYVKAVWENFIKQLGVSKKGVLEITDICDCGTCSHCYIRAEPRQSRKGHHVDPNSIYAWLDAISSIRPQSAEILICGGEPTLHPFLEDILIRINQLGMQAGLATNGEKLVDSDYCQRLLSLGAIDRFYISVRGLGRLHDLLMLSANHPFWEKIPKTLPPPEQIDYALKLDHRYLLKRYRKTAQGLLNLSQLRDENSKRPAITLAMDIQAAADLETIVIDLLKKGVKIDAISLQVIQKAGRAADFPSAIPNLWRTTTLSMVQSYIEQSQRLVKQGVVPQVTMIDPLPEEVVALLNLKPDEDRNGFFYQPEVLPAITPQGELITDVVRTGTTISP